MIETDRAREDQGGRDPFADLPVLAELRERLGEYFEAEERRAASGRCRCRRRLPARAKPVLTLVLMLVVAGSAAAAVTLSIKRSAPLYGRVPSSSSVLAPHFGFGEGGERYRIAFSPQISAGGAGWRSAVSFGAYERQSEFGDGTGYPTDRRPLLAGEGTGIATDGALSEKAIHYVLTGPRVAAVRVGADTIKTRAGPGVPAGDRVAVFLLPAHETPVVGSRSAGHGERTTRAIHLPRFHPEGPSGAPGKGWQPHIIPLDSAGLPIESNDTAASSPALRTRAWHGGAPSAGRRVTACTLRERRSSPLIPAWGAAVVKLRPIANAVGELLLSCLETTYRMHGSLLHAAVLLNARHPGHRPPGAIPGARPVKGHPGTVDAALGRLLGGDLTARRSGEAWLLVEGGRDLAQRLQALSALRIAEISPAPAG